MKASELLTNIGNSVGYHSGLVRYFGSVTATVLFCQLYHWSGRESFPALGIYKTANEILEETGLTYAEQRTARKALRELGILVETPKRLEHRIYYKIDKARLDELLSNPPNEKNRVPELNEVESPNLTIFSSGNEESSVRITERTSESTSEKTNKEISNTNSSNSKANGEKRMSHYNRVSPILRDYFGRVEPKNHYLWKKLKEQIPDERKAQESALNWAADHQDNSYDSPLAAFLGESAEYVTVDRGDRGASAAVKEKTKELSRRVAEYTNGDVAFNERQQRSLREACEEFDVDTLLSAFKRYWLKLDDMGAKFAAKNFSEMASALGASEIKIREQQRKNDEMVSKSSEISARIKEELDKKFQDDDEGEDDGEPAF